MDFLVLIILIGGAIFSNYQKQKKQREAEQAQLQRQQAAVGQQTGTEYDSEMGYDGGYATEDEDWQGEWQQDVPADVPARPVVVAAGGSQSLKDLLAQAKLEYRKLEQQKRDGSGDGGRVTQQQQSMGQTVYQSSSPRPAYMLPTEPEGADDSSPEGFGESHSNAPSQLQYIQPSQDVVRQQELAGNLRACVSKRGTRNADMNVQIVRELVTCPNNWRKAMIYSELLAQPVCKRKRRGV